MRVDASKASRPRPSATAAAAAAAAAPFVGPGELSEHAYLLAEEGAGGAAYGVQRCRCGLGVARANDDRQRGDRAPAKSTTFGGRVLPPEEMERETAVRDAEPETEPIYSPRQVEILLTRTVWLCFLMILQSASSFILQRYTSLIVSHPVVTYSLTFLVGAGGNASAQSAVIVIRGIATQRINRRNELKLVWREILIGAAMGFVLSFCGFLRVFLFSRDVVASMAIGSCLFLIVLSATTIGAVLPFVLQGLGTDPAHAGPAVQVIMDIIGVATCCFVCTAVFAVIEGPANLGLHGKQHLTGAD